VSIITSQKIKNTSKFLNDGFVKSRRDSQCTQYSVLYYSQIINILCYFLILLTFYEFILNR